MIRCAIEERYFAPLRGLREWRERVHRSAVAALDHLRTISYQAAQPLTGSPLGQAGARKAFAPSGDASPGTRRGVF
ncbi:hypothetical protein MPL3365_140112 [Mesorhizobium plurifarium]|uniref:Uncharacterized protein n=1 Tax=Mesorhizobium plurifarium TaxID=69974 RepID=A0A090FXE1_MESPL|nr:hypothetical protein MPL3365_140112 [Mesorhizobium plurifarium]